MTASGLPPSLRPLRLCTLVSSYQGVDSPFLDVDSLPDPARFLPEHEWETRFIVKARADEQVAAAVERGYDAFVCLCDGAADEDCAGVEVVRALERAGVAFTGADSRFFEPPRRTVKAACAAAGVGSPRGLEARRADEAPSIRAVLHGPLLVKHPESYGSIGLRPSSRVETTDELAAEIERMADAFGAALVEEFIEGREFAVLVAEAAPCQCEPLLLPPIEIGFPPGESFKHFDLKWRGYHRLVTLPVDDPVLARLLTGAVAKVFRALGGVGYARCDLRVDARGRPFLLDINSNPGLFYPDGEYTTADEILARTPGGHAAFLEHLLACAELRRERPAARAVAR